jgi:chorismate lyase/3-hydroxybenzoate synthase
MLRQSYLDSTLLAAKQTASSAIPMASPVTLLHKPGVLALIAFDEPCLVPAELGIIPIGIPSLCSKAYEVIEYGDKVAERGSSNDCQWSKIDDVFCAATWISPTDCADIETATEAAYSRLFGLINSAGFPYPFRIWNFMPKINLGEGDQEEYKKFCVGRLRAFSQLDLSQQQFPAASALGIHHSDNATQGAVIYLLATKTPGQHHENPRQQPAYQYPREYGPSSPSFARATSLPLQSHHPIFISGTASIIGHDTKACGNLQEQLEITLENIRYLLASIDPQASTPSAIRVYLRHAEDLLPAQDYLYQQFSPADINIVHADICRANLLVEIECVANAHSLTQVLA